MTEQLRRLVSPYPEARLLMKVVRAVDQGDRHAIARLWLTEGIPFAFREVPALYETARGWFARSLGVHPKELTLIGSSRTGFSLAPKHVGRPYETHSDLDFAVISDRLFADVREAFEAWASDYESGRVRPRSVTENRYWPENMAFGRRNVPKGFMDPHKIPSLDRYPVVQRIGQACWILRKKLSLTEGGFITGQISVRVYRDWESFVNRVVVNLEFAVR